MAKLQHIEETLDVETGEIKTITKTFSVKPKTKNQFFVVFTELESPLFKLTRSNDIKVMLALCSLMEYNSNEVCLTPNKRKELCEQLNITPQSLSNSLSRLKDISLISGARGDYMINALFFFRGTTDKRNQLIADED